MKFLRNIVLVLALPLCSIAQVHTNETSFGFETSIPLLDKLSADFEADMKFTHPFFLLKSHSQEIGFGYSASKSIKIGAAYSLTHRLYDQGFFPRHKMSVNLRYRYRYKYIRFDYRNKSEMSRNTYTNDAGDLLFDFVNRNRIKVSYRRKKLWWEPNITLETFHPLVNTSLYALSEIRYSAAVSFKIVKNLNFDVGYTYKQIFKSSVPKTVSGLSFIVIKDF